MREILINIFNLIGTAMPEACLCYILAFMFRGRRLTWSEFATYFIAAVLLFQLLLRT